MPVEQVNPCICEQTCTCEPPLVSCTAAPPSDRACPVHGETEHVIRLRPLGVGDSGLVRYLVTLRVAADQTARIGRINMEKDFVLGLVEGFDFRIEPHQAQDVLQNGPGLFAAFFD